MEKITKWNIQDFLKTEEDRKSYLKAALEDGDPDMLKVVLKDIAEAQGMAKVARKAKMTREGLYKTLSDGVKPRFETVSKLIHSFGYSLTVL